MTVVIRGLDEVIKKLQTLGSDMPLRRAVAISATLVKDRAAQYPARRHGPMPGFPRSERQRRFFFAALKDGRIEVPYIRGGSPGSEKLGQRWTVVFLSGGTSARIENNASYAPFVMGREQAAYHRITGWPTTDAIADAVAPDVLRIFQREYDQEANA